jgi:hypothetical protein
MNTLNWFVTILCIVLTFALDTYVPCFVAMFFVTVTTLIRHTIKR